VKIVIKMGGTLLDEPASRQEIARQLAEVSHRFKLVVVHGGGKQVTRFLQERGVESRFVGGLRVSDQPVIDAVTKVIAGSVNKQLVAALIAAGESAIGICGVDALLTSAVQLDPELYFVGRPTKTDGRLLDLLTNSGYLPVVACVAGDANGSIYNVNADQMAVSCALGWGANSLIFLTDVEGVKDQTGRIIDQLDKRHIDHLIESGVAVGGMQAKLEAAKTALQGGLQEATIASGHQPDICRRILAGEALGTRFSLQTVTAKEVSQ
jgi:acetylglutamate kinase